MSSSGSLAISTRRLSTALRARDAQRLVDGRGHALGGVEVGVVQHHAHRVHLLQVEGHRPLHQRAARNARRGGMIHLLRVAAAVAM
jgi:hypothetical protein